MIETNITAERIEREPIHEKCHGCGRVTKDSMCSAYPKPAVWWRRGRCPLADHVKIEVISNVKIRAGQQKQKKGR